MSEEPDLLAAVCAHPDDDAPRLAYAAWCDGRGDPRGEFIRYQVALAKLGGDTEQPEGFRLSSLARFIEIDHSGEWSAEVKKIVERCAYFRGFVAQISLSAGTFIENVDRLLALAPIQHVFLEAPGLDVEKLFSMPQLLGFRSLNLYGAKLGDAGIKILSNSPYVRNIRWLCLAQNGIGMEGVESLIRTKNLPSIKYLDLDDNPVNPCEQFGFDQGVMIQSWIPPIGKELEKKFGPIKWLYRDGVKSHLDIPPNAFYT